MHRLSPIEEFKYLVLVFFLIATGGGLLHPSMTLAASTSSGSSPLSFNTESFFIRQLDALRWNYTGLIQFETDRYAALMTNEFRSRLYLADGTPGNIQDEHLLSLSLSRNIAHKVSLVSDVYSYHFSTTNLHQYTGHIGVQYKPVDDITISALGGMMSDQRQDDLDQGWSGIFRGRSRSFHIGDFSFRPEAEVQYARIAPREYANYRFLTHAHYRSDEVRLQSRFFYSSGLRESYQPSSFFNRDITNIIESVRNDSTALDLFIEIPVTEQIDVSIDIFSLNHTRLVESRLRSEDQEDPVFDTRTTRQEFQIRTLANYRTGRSLFSGGLSFEYINRGSRLVNASNLPDGQVTRRNEILRSSNFDQTRLELFTQNRIYLSDRNELIVRAQSGILRYDTPEDNLDDRDELRHLLTVSNRHVFSPFFTMALHAGAEATHYVYLSATRSIENNWRRSIRLNPVIEWQPHDRIQWNHSFLARANYTVEDYQIEGRPKNDQSSREYAVRSDITIKMANEWFFETEMSRSELRIGRLYWDSFQETPTDTLITYDVRAMIAWEPGRHRIGFGGRFFLRRDYLPQSTITSEIPGEDEFMIPVSRTAPGIRYSRQLGPAVDVDLRFSSGNRLIIRGWVQRQHTWRRLYTTYEEPVREVLLAEERQRTRRLYPNLEIRAVFSF